MLATPFLTDLDPQAAVKGSRDPLGLQVIWARLGRHLVANLTTVSTSARDFTTLILGHYFAERVANAAPSDGDLAAFLRWEQLAAYARGGINGDWNFRGVERAQRYWNAEGALHLGADAGSQILSNQKTYGLWGLYTGPARASALVSGEPTRLTPEGRSIVERLYLPVLTAEGFKNGDAVVARLSQPRTVLDPNRNDKSLLKAVAKILSKRLSPAEREVYRTYLLLGGPNDKTEGKQAVLAGEMESTLDDKEWRLSPSHVRHLAKRCRDRSGGRGESVADRLDRIRTAELLLAPAAALFDLILGSDGQTVAEVSHVVNDQWGPNLPTVDVDNTTRLQTELVDATGEPETGRRWVDLARSLATGDYEKAVTLLLEQNAFVMKVRAGAAPWVEVSNRALRVRLRDDRRGDLPTRSELTMYWRHSYFLDSLRTMALAIRA